MNVVVRYRIVNAKGVPWINRQLGFVEGSEAFSLMPSFREASATIDTLPDKQLAEKPRIERIALVPAGFED